MRKRSGARRLTVWLGVSLSLIPALAAAQGWRSPLADRELVVIEKIPAGDPSTARPLPPPVQALLGPDFVEYETFVAARLPGKAARSLVSAALGDQRNAFQDSGQPVVLPFQTFGAEAPAARTSAWKGRRLRPVPVPGLFLVRFAYPILEEWKSHLRDCGAEPILYYGNGVYLTRARHLGVLQSCHPVSRFLSWAEPFLTTDRTSPGLLDAADLEMKPYSLVFAPGTSLDAALGELPAAMETGESMTWADGTLSLGARAGAPELEALLQTSRHLLGIHEAGSEPQPSDERQGQIIAGNYVGYPGAVTGAVNTTGYLTWLTNRGLRTAANQQTVAVFDTGYDDGTPPADVHHPDLENPERLLPQESQGNFVFSPTTPATEDRRGHGTFVAGIIAGASTGLADAQGFKLGTGIAPDAKLVAVQIFDSTSTCGNRSGLGDLPPTNLGNAISFSRLTSSGADKAFIANHSWNTNERGYDPIAKLFDDGSIDASPGKAGAQAMLLVVAAGNGGSGGQNTVAVPATAKNVVAVGSTQNYRPSTQLGAPTNDCTNPGIVLPPEFTQEANTISQISGFSAQGSAFVRINQGLPLAHQVRIKPDLVAPGGKIFSTIPFQSSAYTCPELCRVEWPTGSSYTFASGTSFAAPVVTGVAALLRKWFLDKGLANPSPSLLKAAVIATATDLGPAHNGDHRPSYKFGWGRVNLERLTDPSVVRFYSSESFSVATGGQKSWTRTIDNAGRDTLIVLAWSDPSSPVTSGHPPLVNDLRLRVDLVDGNLAWHGNNFGENINGSDNGYSHPYVTAAAPANDTMNNVEAIFIPANTFSPGRQILIRVIGSNVPQGPQAFSVYAYNVRLNS